MSIIGKHGCGNVGESNESIHLCLNHCPTALVVLWLQGPSLKKKNNNNLVSVNVTFVALLIH